jgi:beta-glucosidase
MVLDDIKSELQVHNTNDFYNDFFLGLSLKEIICKESQSTIPNLNIKNTELTLENFKKNILTIKELGIVNFSFSLSWEAILPEGIGFVNQTKIAFYHEVLDFCIAHEIEPFVTLFDSNLPDALEKKGGWSNREILDWFENYACICATAFKSKVKNWIVLNQPSVFTGVNFFLDKHSLNKKRLNLFLPALHHSLLCLSIGNKIIKQIDPKNQVGSIFSSHFVIPKTLSNNDFKATERIDSILNKLFLEPSLGLGYPFQTLPCLKSISNYFLKGDDDLLKADFDFIGLHNYKPILVAHDLFVPFINARVVKLNIDESETVPLEFERNTNLIYRVIKKYSKYKEIKKIFVIENTISLLEDPKLLIDYHPNEIIQIKPFLQQIIKAKNSVGKVHGCFISLKNNTNLNQSNL